VGRIDLRDRRLTEPAADQPFEHQHYGDWVPMVLLRSAEVEREGWIRREDTFSCPSCSYELTESTPVRAVDLPAVGPATG
jgi:hypothetical protein